MKRSAFTIWELLAAIVIVLVVAAILFPVFAKGHGCTRCISCASDEKQIGLAVAQYAMENGNDLPDIADAPNSPNTWRNAVYSFAKSKGVYQCPSRDDKTNGPDGFPRSYAANYTGNYSGSKNDHGDGAFAGPGSKGINVLDIPDPKNLIMLCEVIHHSTPDFNIDNLAVFNPHSHFLYTGHTDGSNYLFIDNHVKFFRPLDTKDKWHRNPRIPLTPAAVALLADAQRG